ncbi:sensor histidine kinase [Spirilliplanes yamanashiensis]|nr:ATP-binding protein [Spirilliplanes yamanashiensis]
MLIALGLVATGTAAANREHLDTILDKAGPMRAAAETLNTALVNQETGIRGYAVSGEQIDLQPYEAGVAGERQQIEAIRTVLASGDDDIRADLDAVEAGAAAWRAAVAEPVLTAVRDGGPAAAQPLLDDDARARFDTVRADVQRLQQDILSFRTETAAAARSTGNMLVLLLICAAAVIVLAGVVLLIGLDRLVSRPVLRLAAQIRAVADGDYEGRISSDGSPELSRLADDVDAMRRQIASELAQVREAREQIEWVNKQLHAQADELTRSNRDLEQFAYVASHDLQEPLRKVASFCQLLQRRYAGQLDERADQYIGFAVDGAQRMQRLINDLLAFSRIGRLTSGFTDVDLNRILTDVSSQLEARLGDDGKVSWSDLPTIEGEEPLLTTLFVNLIGNSLKFRRPDVPPEVTVSARRDGAFWEVTVRDNGIGIEPEFADKVFVIFQRLHARDAYEGTGIGLAIVKKIVEYHGGRIWLNADVPEGTAISFTFPVAPHLGADDHEQNEAVSA